MTDVTTQQSFQCHCVEHSLTPIGTVSTSKFVQEINAEDEDAAFTEAMQRLQERYGASTTITSFNVYKVEEVSE